VLSSHQPPVLRAVIDEDGVLALSGLPTGPLTAEHDDPTNAYAELINLCLDLAEQAGGPVWLHANTPTGLWGMAVHVDGTTIPLPLELFDPPGSHDGSDGTPADDQDALAALLAELDSVTPPPARVVLTLAADPAPGIRAAAIAELSTWGDDPNAVVEAELDATTLAGLADCRLAWVRAGVAAHPGTDPITLTQLATELDPLIGQALAARPDLPPELVAALAEHPDPFVRAELGRNPAAAFLRHRRVDDAQSEAQTSSHSDIRPSGEPQRTAPPPGASAELDSDAVRSAPARHRARPAAPPPAAPGKEPRAVARTPRRRIGGRQWAGIGVAAVVLVGAGTAVAAGRDDSPPARVAPSTSAAVAWHGTWLPASPDGPADPAAPIVTGFAHTPTGAALAAAHLSVRIDPYAGPASFTATIRDQTYGGDPGALLASTRAAYQKAAHAAGVDDGAPVPSPVGRITGWAAPGWTPDGPVTVHLRVSAPDGGLLDYAIAVAWVNGDYRLVDPTSAGTFVTTTAPDADGYTPF
jgi:hypothetical protein